MYTLHKPQYFQKMNHSIEIILNHQRKTLDHQEVKKLVIRDRSSGRYVNYDGSPLIFDHDYQYILVGKYWYAWTAFYKVLEGVSFTTKAPPGKFHLNHESWPQ